MINKSVYEDALIYGMQHELQPKKATNNDLLQAVEYLNSAVEIFEEAGMTAKADQVLRILGKLVVAHDSKVRSMPSMKALMDAGVTQQDLKNINDPFSKARVNTALRVLGYSDKEIAGFLGDKFMSESDAATILNPERPYKKIMDWIQNPQMATDPKNPQPGEEISFKSLAEHAPPQRRKPKNPTSVSHSHQMNPLEMALSDDSKADDLLDLDINDAEMELLDQNPEDKTFEDAD